MALSEHDFAKTCDERCVDGLVDGSASRGIEVGGNVDAGEVESLSE